jgi:hypothetical protein
MKKMNSGIGGFHPPLFGKMRMLMEEVKEGKGGGGGDDDDEVEDKKFEQRFNKLFHRAAKERDSRLTEKLTKSLTETLGGSVAKQLEDLKKMLTDDSDGDEKKEKSLKLSPEIEATIRQAQKDAEEAKSLAKKWQKDAEEASARSDRNEERSALVGKLSGKVKPALLDMVVDRLHAKHITRDPDTKKMLWKDGDEALPFDSGIDSWTKSDEAKEVAPPRDVRGGGGRGPDGSNNSQNGPLTMEGVGAIISGSIPR